MTNRLLAICAILAAGLAGCATGSPQADSTAEPTAGAQAPRLPASAEGELPLQMQLVIGTFSLEQSELAVSAEQAQELLPLWKALQSLNNSDTAAQAEIDALTEQIQQAMTPAQIEAIAGLELNAENLAAVMEELDILPQFQAQLGGDEADGEFSIPPGGFVSGQAPGGGPPGGGVFGGPGGGTDGGGGAAAGGFTAGPGGAFGGLQGTPDPDQIATLQASGAGGGAFGARATSFLIPALIDLLEERAATGA